MRKVTWIPILILSALLMTGCKGIGETDAQPTEAPGEDVPAEVTEQTQGEHLSISDRAETVNRPTPTQATEQSTAPEMAIPRGSKVCWYGLGAEGVSTVCSDSCSVTKNNREGIVIQLSDDDIIPNIKIRWISGQTDAVTYTEQTLVPNLRNELGERCISFTSPCYYMIEGKDLYGAEFKYTAENGKTAVSHRYVEACENGLIVYSTEAYEKKTTACDKELDRAVRYALPGTYAYSNAYVSDKDEIPLFSLIPDDAASVRLIGHDEGDFRLTIPSGWQVVSWNSGLYHSFRAYDPSNPDRQIFVSLKLSGLLKSWAARQWFTDRYGMQYINAKAPVLEDISTEEFYVRWNNVASYIDSIETEVVSLPEMDDFSLLENMGPTEFGGDLIRGRYIAQNGIRVQGFFTETTVVESENFSAVADDGESRIDIGNYDAFSIVFVTAPEEEFVEWADILMTCLSSLEYSHEFQDDLYEERHVIYDAVMSNEGLPRDFLDTFRTAWDNRTTSYDIDARKAADAKSDFMRVYDTETGAVYKADLGFFEQDDSGRYRPITEDMYLMPVAGFIRK